MAAADVSGSDRPRRDGDAGPVPADDLRALLAAMEAAAAGDFSARAPLAGAGLSRELAGAFNRLVESNERMADEVARAGRAVGRDGLTTERAVPPVDAAGWRSTVEAVNTLIDDLVRPTTEFARVIESVARGDLSQRMAARIEGHAVRGEFLGIRETVNQMVGRLSSFADEVTRVAREVGTEGRLGGQATVEGVSGTWRDLTDSVNSMAFNLTSQVRNIAHVATAVARGDLSQKITVGARGEVLELATTMNTMVDQLSSFADEVTRVAREVGSEGKLGGQARVEDVSGTWRALTYSVNSMAANLTAQVRAIAAVSTAVTRGDLTRSIGVAAQGEVAELKDTINQMIVNLRETTRRNAEQAWLNANLARFGGMMQGQRDLGVVSELIMSELTPLAGAQLGAFFLVEPGEDGEEVLQLAATYGYRPRDDSTSRIRLGEGMVGQAALDRAPMLIEGAPDGYVTVASALGRGEPKAILVQPVLFEDRLMGVIELASLEPFPEVRRTFLEQLAETIGIVINAIVANMRTHELLEQSQSLTHELQSRQSELQQTNAELADQNARIEVKNREIEMTRLAIEEKAEQLALSSLYKSQFLANMSHELRTPLNSLLILARLLADNADGNLTDTQVEFAQTIFTAGNELLDLIDDILDLSKVEAGKMGVERGDVSLPEVVDGVERAFRPLVEEKGLHFEVTLDDDVRPVIVSDRQRLLQILRNLIANAVKFTEAGSVSLRIGRASPGAAASDGGLAAAETIAFSVADTGIGIPEDRLELIFEAFQQADGTTSRRFGGTGLGLSISREIAHLLGGELAVESTPGAGSRFTLLLPATMPEPAPGEAREPRARPLRAVAPAAVAADRRAPATPPRAAAAPPPAGSGDTRRLAGRRVLIVDDDMRNVFALASALEACGADVSHADTGRAGLEVLRGRDDLDVVLLDAMMPGMDGYAVTREIRSLPHLARLPVIVVTATATADAHERALAAGASDHVTKPIDTGDLLSRMARCLGDGAGSGEDGP